MLMENLNMIKMVQNKRFIVLSLIICLLISCSSYKQLLSNGTDEQSAINNIIIDYYFSNNKEIQKYNVFNISNRMSSNESLYYFDILPQENVYSLHVTDSLGSYSRTFPTNYRVYEERLFLWNNKGKKISQEVLDIMYNYKVLDSIALKYQIGIYDDWDSIGKYPPLPLFKVNEKLKGVDYVVCKNNVSIFTKTKTHLHVKIENLSIPNCYK